MDEQDTPAALALLRQAVPLAPGVVPLIQQACEALLQAQQPAEAAAIIAQATLEAQRHGRIRMLKVRAALAQGDTLEAKQFFGEGIVIDDIREGEVSVTDVWYQWQTLLRSRERQLPMDEHLLRQVKQDLSPPAAYEFRLGAAS